MFIFLSYVYMHVSVCVVMCTCEYGYSWSLEERVGAAGVPGDCKLPVQVLGTEFKSSEKQYALLT